MIMTFIILILELYRPYEYYFDYRESVRKCAEHVLVLLYETGRIKSMRTEMSQGFTCTADEIPAAAVHLFTSVNTFVISLFPAVSKNQVVQLSIVRCQIAQKSQKSGSKRSHTKRSSIQECYRRTEIWSLQDLTLVDGRDPDVVINQISLQLPFLIIAVFPIERMIGT